MAYRSSRVDDMPLSVSLFFLALFAAGLIGWIWNVVKIVGSVAEPITTMFIVRCVGVFLAPLGAILGFL